MTKPSILLKTTVVVVIFMILVRILPEFTLIHIFAKLILYQISLGI